MKQSITGYHQDDEGHWVAQLACGHNQHVRHDPPLIDRAWVMSAQGRAGMLGEMLGCVNCDAGEPISTDSPSMPIESNRNTAIFFACTDTWVLGVIVLGGITLAFPIYITLFPDDSAPPGGAFRLFMLTLGYWIVFGLAITPRFIQSYTIARHGYYVLSKVMRHEDFGIGKRASTRLIVSYVRNGKRQTAKASVLGKIPQSGTDILVAVHPQKSHRYRVLPYDYLLSKWARVAIIEKIKRLQAISAGTAQH